jgi:uncharacterized protein YbjT (DUF2867 family)
MAETILVFGATGTVGQHVVADLVAAGRPVRAATRGGAAPAGAEGVAVDLDDPAGLGRAFDGVASVFLLLPTGSVDPIARITPAIEAAARARARIVFMSAMGVDADENIPYRRIERLIEGSGSPFAVIRPNWFMDNFHTFWRPGVSAGTIALPAGEGRTSFVDARDIGATAAALLVSGRHDGTFNDLTGPEALGYAEAAAILSRATGRTIGYQAIDDEAFVAMMTGAGVPEAYARFLASIFHPVREGWTAKVTDAVARITGRAPRTLAAYAADRAGLLTG